MAGKYRIAVIGFAHMHIDSNLKAFAACGDRVELVAVADVPPRVPTLSAERCTRVEGLKRAAEQYGMKNYACDWRKLLDENRIDIALVCCENAFHPAVTEELLARGIHVVLEKPLAATTAGALRMWRAARLSGKKIVTNWPTAWSPAIRTAKELVDSGRIGKVFKFSYRNSDSQGPFSYGQNLSEAEKAAEWWYQSEAGGGAMLDYCGYGACMACWYIGEQPVSAYGLKANMNAQYADAEDFSAITVRFPGAVAQLEGSWTTVNGGVPAGPLVYGDKGTLVVSRSDGVELYMTRHKTTPDEVVEAKPLPAGRTNLGEETLWHLETGEPLLPILDLPLNLAAVSILDAGARSAESGKMEMTRDAVWSSHL